MVKLFLFIKQVYVFLLFIILEIMAVNYYVSSSSYTQARLLTLSNTVLGEVHEGVSDFGGYFGLRNENQRLLDEVVRLRNELSVYQSIDTSARVVVPTEIAPYFYSWARVVNNSVAHPDNFITINRGLRDGVQPKMALLSSEGVIAGYVLECSEKYSVAMSVLNKNMRTSGKLKGEDFEGSLLWDGIDPEYLTLTEVPKYAQITKGDTIVTTGYSDMFPPEIMIGTVESWEFKNALYFEVRVRLGARIGTLKDVLLVKYADGEERRKLEESVVVPAEQ